MLWDRFPLRLFLEFAHQMANGLYHYKQLGKAAASIRGRIIFHKPRKVCAKIYQNATLFYFFGHIWILWQRCMCVPSPFSRPPDSRVTTNKNKAALTKAIRYYNVRFYPLCIHLLYYYPWRSD